MVGGILPEKIPLRKKYLVSSQLAEVVSPRKGIDQSYRLVRVESAALGSVKI